MEVNKREPKQIIWKDFKNQHAFIDSKQGQMGWAKNGGGQKGPEWEKKEIVKKKANKESD